MNTIDLFFPGVFVHEAAHAFACWLGEVKVHRMVVHRSSGMVVHEQSSVRNALVIGLAPLLVGSVLSFVLFGMVKQAWERDIVWAFALLWLAFSIAFHSIPSYQDMRNIPSAVGRRWNELWRSERGLVEKIGKSSVYVAAGLAGWGLVGAAALVDLSLIFRVVWSVALGAIA